MESIKRIALVAHDNRKNDLIEWVEFNKGNLTDHSLFCTGTTGSLVEKTLGDDYKLTRLKSGPLGGDQQLGALIADEKIDLLIFFWDPMSSHPHDVDVKALLRLSVLYNIPTACNRATAEFIISSPLYNSNYQRIVKDYSTYINRTV
ncbi:MAG: methylglyoxal synthase [Bacteroidetes bacterium]|nr:methylglyoxal synthase [Bacteroidota bacterium]MBL6943103.1 methylglyoxal synthase [Bacteroidales bacterium]